MGNQSDWGSLLFTAAFQPTLFEIHPPACLDNLRA
jgi:hypothetical protein